MEFVDSSLNSGISTYAEKLSDKPRSVDKNVSIEKDNFHCMFFRQPKHQLMRIHTFVATSESWLSFNLSDTCTDSGSERNEQMNTTPGSQTISSSLCTIDDQISPAGRKAPRVTFGRTSYIRSGKTAKTSLRDLSLKLKRDTRSGFRKTALLPQKQNYLRENYDLKNKKYTTRSCTTRWWNNSEVESEKRTLKDKSVVEKCRRNKDDTYEHPGILRGGKQSYEVTNTIWQKECEGTTKRKFSAENRLIRNKRLLKSMEEIIHEINEQEGPCQKLASVQSIEPETNVAKEMQNEKREKIAIFKKSGVEKMLNDSMHRAILKYRTRTKNTWNVILKGESLKT